MDDWNENNWREQLDKSHIFLIILTDGYMEDPLCVEQCIYAKEKNLPIVVIKEKCVKEPIPDLFKNPIVIEINDLDDEKDREKTFKALNELKSKLKKGSE